MNVKLEPVDQPFRSARPREAKCRCDARIYERVVGSDSSFEWAHFVGEAFDAGNLTRCFDGGSAEPA